MTDQPIYNPPALTDLIDYEVTVPMFAGPHRRDFVLRVPAVSESFALGAGAAISLAINEASGWAWKHGGNKHADGTVRELPAPSIKDPGLDKYTAQLGTVPGLSVVVDDGGCIVLRYPGGSTTISNVDAFVTGVLTARHARNKMTEDGEL